MTAELQHQEKLSMGREAISGVLTALFSKGFRPKGIRYEPGMRDELCDQNVRKLLDDIWASECCWVRWERDGNYAGTTFFTPFEGPSDVLCDWHYPSIGGRPNHPVSHYFDIILDQWSSYNGYE